MKSLSTTIYRAVFALCALLAMPAVTHASYTMYGQEFSTLDELVSYTEEYGRVYKEIYGTSITSTITSEATRTALKRSTAPRPVSVTTDSAQNVYMYSARLTGRVSTTNTKAVRVWFEYGTNIRFLTARTADEVLYEDRSLREFDSELRKLTPNTMYYYRAVAVNDSGTVNYGTVKSFKTAVDPKRDTAAARIRTTSVFGTDEAHTTLRGTIDFRKAKYVRVWFEYGDDEKDLYMKTPRVVVNPSSGKIYQRTVSKLDESTQYYYRMVGEDPNGARSYGATRGFKTKKDILNEKPKVTIDRATIITSHDAVITGAIDMNDFRNGVAFIVYGEDKDALRTISKDYRRYKSIREDGDGLQKLLLDDDLDKLTTFKEQLLFLDLGTTIYASVGVEYENAEGDNVILMSRTISFKTKEQ